MGWLLGAPLAFGPAEDVPTKSRQQFFAANTGRFFDQWAMLRRQWSLQMSPLVNADRADLQDACERRLPSGEVAGTS